MALYHPTRVIGFHSCDREIGLRILNGRDWLRPSNNSWDWLGDGVYFWEENPGRALEYAQESAQRKQFNLVRISTPFVLGAVIDLGHCLNLVERESLQILSEAYESLKMQRRLLGVLSPKTKATTAHLIVQSSNISIIPILKKGDRPMIPSGALSPKERKPSQDLLFPPVCIFRLR